MKRALGYLAAGSLPLALGCEAVASFSATLFNLGLLALFVAGAIEVTRRLINPARFDPAARALDTAARQLRLPAPRRARRLAWPLPSGLEAQADADEHLELSVDLAARLPATLVVDRPSLPPGVALSRVPVPAGMLGDYFVLGAEGDAVGVLSRSVREALVQTANSGLHVLMEQGRLRVRLPLSAAGLTEEASARLDRVARAVVQRPEDPAARLATIVRAEEPRRWRTRALAALLEDFPEAPITAEVAAEARSEALDEARLRRWAGRHGQGALSLSEAAGAGAVGIVDGDGGLSTADSEDDEP